jgi:hypothetical protein
MFKTIFIFFCLVSKTLQAQPSQNIQRTYLEHFLDLTDLPFEKKPGRHKSHNLISNLIEISEKLEAKSLNKDSILSLLNFNLEKRNLFLIHFSHIHNTSLWTLIFKEILILQSSQENSNLLVETGSLSSCVLDDSKHYLSHQEKTLSKSDLFIPSVFRNASIPSRLALYEKHRAAAKFRQNPELPSFEETQEILNLFKLGVAANIGLSQEDFDFFAARVRETYPLSQSAHEASKNALKSVPLSFERRTELLRQFWQ